MPSFRSHICRRLLARHRKRARVGEPTIEQGRLNLDDLGRRIPFPNSVSVRATTVLDLSAEWLIPSHANEHQVILYLHGGGYCGGSRISHRGLVAAIAKASQIRAFLPEYRLAPESPFPAAVEDTTNIYRELLKKYDPENIVIVGDSAGGGLAIATLLNLRDSAEPLPAAAAVMSPWADLAVTGASVKTKANDDPMLRADGLKPTAELYHGVYDPMHPLISPIYADLTDLPPLLIQVGTEEVLFSDSERLAQKAELHGVDLTYKVWEGMWHVWHGFVDLMPESQAAIEELAQFLQKQLSMPQEVLLIKTAHGD